MVHAVPATVVRGGTSGDVAFATAKSHLTGDAGQVKGKVVARRRVRRRSPQAELLFRVSFLCLVFRRAQAHNLPVLAERSPASANYQEQLTLVCRTPSGFVVGGGGRGKGRLPGRSGVEDSWVGILVMSGGK